MNFTCDNEELLKNMEKCLNKIGKELLLKMSLART